jgi:hypothetical protein
MRGEAEGVGLGDADAEGDPVGETDALGEGEAFVLVVFLRCFRGVGVGDANSFLSLSPNESSRPPPWPDASSATVATKPSTSRLRQFI